MEQQLEKPPFAVAGNVKLIIGLFLAVLGVLMTLDNLDIVNADVYLRYWPVVLIAVGLIKLNDAAARSFAVAAIVAGALLLAWNTRWLRFSIFDLWPLLLIGAGVVIIMQAVRGGDATASQGNAWYAVLSHRKIAIDSKNFTGGRIVAFMGGVDLDLTQADIQKGPAVIEMFVLMGGVEMTVPDGWEIIGDAVPFMGGFEVKTKSKRTGKQLVLRGFVMMGGTEIKDVTARTR
jgi:predicted membrane protein